MPWGILNQQNLYLIPPTIVALLLQYRGFRIVHMDGFSCRNDRLILVVSIWILGFHKNCGFL